MVAIDTLSFPFTFPRPQWTMRSPIYMQKHEYDNFLRCQAQMLNAVPVIAESLRKQMKTRKVSLTTNGCFRIQTRTLYPGNTSSLLPNLQYLQVKIREDLAQDIRISNIYISISVFDGYAMEVLDKSGACFMCCFPFALMVFAAEKAIFYGRLRLHVVCTGKVSHCI